MSIYAQPDTAFTAVADNAPTGLAGTIGVTIKNLDGTTEVARTTSGIVEIEPGSGIYVATLTSPDTQGDYIILWDTGSGATAEETLTVTSTIPSGTDLTTLENVRAFLQKNTGDTNQDTVIQQLITRASVAIETYAGREFHPTDGAARTFNYTGGHHLDLSPYELRSITAMSVDSETATPTTLAVNGDYWLSPASSIGGTYTGISFPSASAIYDNYRTDRRQVTIIGNWGFAAVPADVEHACILTVGIWLRRDVAAFSTTFQIDEQRLERPEALPSAARGLVDRYRSVVVVG